MVCAESNAVRLLAGTLAALSFCFPAAGAPRQKWVEVRSPHFIVVSDAGERQARRVANEFEQFRAVFQLALPSARVDSDRPVVILATKDEKGLRALLPSFWEQEGRTRPSGVFVPGGERYYAAVLVGAPGSNPYHTLYHEYVHLLNQINFRNLPVWLSEGLAEVYAGTLIGSRTVDVGQPDEEHLTLLRSERLLPLETLLAVDHSSPYYNEADKVSVFYAQSWALTHLLLFGDEARRGQLQEFIRLAARGVVAPVAVRQAFGDLRTLEKQLQAYCRQTSFRLLTLAAPETTDPKIFSLRELSPAESLALRGDFFLHTHRPAEARAALNEALRLSPGFLPAQESLGQLALLEDDRQEAFRWYQRAVEGGSQSYLAHYYYAVLLTERTADPDLLELVKAHLEQSIDLKPDFAPAHAALSGFYGSQPSQIEDALEHAETAARLDPEALEYQLNVGRLLLRMQRVEKALAIGEEVLAAALTEEDRDSAEGFLATARKYQSELLAWKRAEEEARVAAEERRKRNEAEAAVRAAEESAKLGPPPQPQWGAGKPRRVTGSAVEGWISSVTCTENRMDLQLNLGPYLLRLHSSDYFEMGLLASGWTPPNDFDPCRHLKGRRAIVIYRAVENKAYAGEILAIQVNK